MFRPARVLNVNNAPAVLDAGMRAIAGGQTDIDLADLVIIDSAAVATLLAWQRAACGQNKTLVFHNLPDNLQSLADLYGATALLHPVSCDDTRSDLPHH
jgi:phospholipid transport system transporter-binding protein